MQFLHNGTHIETLHSNLADTRNSPIAHFHKVLKCPIQIHCVFAIVIKIFYVKFKGRYSRTFLGSLRGCFIQVTLYMLHYTWLSKYFVGNVSLIA